MISTRRIQYCGTAPEQRLQITQSRTVVFGSQKSATQVALGVKQWHHYYHYNHTVFLPRGKVRLRQAAVKAAKVLPLVDLPDPSKT